MWIQSIQKKSRTSAALSEYKQGKNAHGRQSKLSQFKSWCPPKVQCNYEAASVQCSKDAATSEFKAAHFEIIYLRMSFKINHTSCNIKYHIISHKFFGYFHFAVRFFSVQATRVPGTVRTWKILMDFERAKCHLIMGIEGAPPVPPPAGLIKGLWKPHWFP